MAKRDDFPQSIKLVLAQRAGYFCSSPDCRTITSAPHSDPAKAIVTGEAAHICAAAEGGPRYDATQTPEQRRSILNAIWLCGNCNKKVDTDWKAWPAAQLTEMKQAHEQWVAATAMIPKPPTLSLATRTGLRPHKNIPPVTDLALAILREQELTLGNPNHVRLTSIKLVLQLPEQLLRYGLITASAGTEFTTSTGLAPWVVTSAGAGAVVSNAEKPSTRQELQIASLSAGDTASFAFYTANPVVMKAYAGQRTEFRDIEDPDAMMAGSNLLFTFIRGTYQFEFREEFVTSEFFVPMRYSFRERTLTSLPMQDTSDGWRVQESHLFPSVEIGG